MADRSWTKLPALAVMALSGHALAQDPPPASSTTTPAPPVQAQPGDPAGRPPSLHVEYAQYGVGLLALVNMAAGASCSGAKPSGAPCIIGNGGGVVVRGGYRAAGSFYYGGGYSFAKMDSSNLYRLGIFQQLWAEMRYLPDFGFRAAPYATWGLGGVTYGNEWGVETGGAMIFGGGGVAFQVSRVAVVGLGATYKPTVLVRWTDTAGIVRPTGVAHFLGFELQLELRTEIGRR